MSRFSFKQLSLPALMMGTCLLTAGATYAAPAAQAPAATKEADPNTLIATVNGDKITLGQVQTAIAALPPQARQLQPNVVVPLVVDQLIEQKAIQDAAVKEKLENATDVKRAMETAADNVLQNAYLERKIGPEITEQAIQAYYDAHYAHQKPVQEIHARHILVKDQKQAQDIINQLNHGADFGKLASAQSEDKGSAGTNGGDLGWFKRGDMIPTFSDAAFAMKPNEISKTPVKTQYGWHVIQVQGTRMAPVPALGSVKQQIRRELLREDVRKVVQSALKQVKVVRYDANGKPLPVQASKKKR